MKTARLEVFRNTPSKSIHSLTRRAIATMLVAAFTIGSTALAVGAPFSPQTGTEKAPTLKERVLAIPPHAMVQVKLRRKEKIKGRLGEVTNEGFVVQTATGDKIDNQKVSFGEVKSIKAIGGGGKKSRVALYVVTGVAVTLAVTLLFLLRVASAD